LRSRIPDLACRPDARSQRARSDEVGLHAEETTGTGELPSCMDDVPCAARSIENQASCEWDGSTCIYPAAKHGNIHFRYALPLRGRRGPPDILPRRYDAGGASAARPGAVQPGARAAYKWRSKVASILAQARSACSSS
jgi:hypothetical protein